MSNVYGQTLLDDMVHSQSLPLPLVREAAREILLIIREGLVQDKVVNVSNFGTFRLKAVAARRGFNPQTREPITIPAHQRVIFSPCKALRELIQPRHPQPIPLPRERVPGRAAARSAPIASSPVIATRRIVPPVSEIAAAPTVVETKTSTSSPGNTEALPQDEPAVWAEYTAEPQRSDGAQEGAAVTPQSAPESAELSLELDEKVADEAARPASKRYYYLGVAALIVIAVITASLLREATTDDVPTPAVTVITPAQQTPSPTSVTPAVTPAVSIAPPSNEPSIAQPSAPVEETDYSTLYTELADASRQGEAVTSPSPSTNGSVVELQSVTATMSIGGSDFYFQEQRHTISSGESLWRLARSHYHDPLLWPHIYQANAAVIDDPDQLRAGREIVIPTLQGAPEALTKTDRRNIAEGYYLTYLHYKANGHQDAFFALLEAKRYDNKVVEEHRSLLQLSKVEEILLGHQKTMPF